MNSSVSNTPLEALRDYVLAMPMAQTLGLRFDALAPGEVTLSAPVQPSWCFAPGGSARVASANEPSGDSTLVRWR